MFLATCTGNLSSSDFRVITSLEISCKAVFFDFQDLFSTAMEFAKLEKVELGGIKGKMLSHQVVEIFAEFSEIFSVFGNRTYDGLDPTNRVRGISFSMLALSVNVETFC